MTYLTFAFILILFHNGFLISCRNLWDLSSARLKAPLSPGPRLLILCYLSITLDRLKAPLGLKPGSPVLFSLCNSNVHTLLAYGHGKVCPKARATILGSHYADGYPDVNASRGGVLWEMTNCCHYLNFIFCKHIYIPAWDTVWNQLMSLITTQFALWVNMHEPIHF